MAIIRNRFVHLALTSALVPCLALSGCTHIQDTWEEITAEEKQGAAVGGLTGAALGALIGSGVAGKGKRTEGALLGGLVGGLAGLVAGQQVGDYVHEKKKDYRTERDFLVAQVEESRRTREQVERLNKGLETDVARLQERRDAAAAQAAELARIKRDAAALDADLATVDRGLDRLIDVNEEAIRTADASRSAEELRQLREEIESLKAERQRLEAHREALARVS